MAFDILYTATIGVFYQSSSTSSCGGIARNTAAGYATGVCLNGGTLSSYFGGGAAWFDCTLRCGSAAGKLNITTGISHRSSKLTNLVQRTPADQFPTMTCGLWPRIILVRAQLYLLFLGGRARECGLFKCRKMLTG